MRTLHTHYDNLKIARNAPANVIRAAYKVLSQQYHPDRNPGSPEASRIMTVINMAYAVLSDPTRRNEYDQFLGREEEELFEAELRQRQQSSAREQASVKEQASAKDHAAEYQQHSRSSAPPQQAKTGPADIESPVAPDRPTNWDAYLIPALVVLMVMLVAVIKLSSMPTEPASEAPFVQVTASVQTGKLATPPISALGTSRRFMTASNGAAWPDSSGYVPWAPRLKLHGQGNITVDNTQNRFDVIAKVYLLDELDSPAVRTVYLQAGTWFPVKNLPSGRYDIHYRDLISDAIIGVGPFVLGQGHGSNPGTTNDIRVALYDYMNLHSSPLRRLRLDDEF